MGLKEIAEMTGYSVSTVSRVLNSRRKFGCRPMEKDTGRAAYTPYSYFIFV